MIGATITTVGMPASDSCAMASSRFVGRRRGPGLHGARQLAVERRHRQRELDEALLPMGARISMSRVTSADLVTMPTG